MFCWKCKSNVHRVADCPEWDINKSKGSHTTYDSLKASPKSLKTSRSQSKLYCENHGHNWTHDTGSCRYVPVNQVNNVTVAPVIDLYDLPDIDELSHLTDANRHTETKIIFSITVLSGDRLCEAPQILVKVDFGQGPITCLVDSGAEISVIPICMVKNDVLKQSTGRVRLVPVFGESMITKVVNVPARLCPVNILQSVSNISFVTLSVSVINVMASRYPLLSVADYSLLRRRDNVAPPEIVYIPSMDVVSEQCLDESLDVNPECLNDLNVSYQSSLSFTTNINGDNGDSTNIVNTNIDVVNTNTSIEITNSCDA